MFDATNVPVVDDDELLARFILSSSDYRKSDLTVKPRLFLPFKHVALSVNRHRESNEQEIWEVGSQVADQRECTLHGRADVTASSCRIETLDVRPEPLPGNPNHADITGYPAKKEDQLSHAMKLAAAAGNRIALPVE